MTQTTFTTADITEAAMIRPDDDQAREGLTRLALSGAEVKRGSIAIAGAQHPAYIACTPSGRVLAAAVLDTESNDEPTEGK